MNENIALAGRIQSIPPRKKVAVSIFTNFIIQSELLASRSADIDSVEKCGKDHYDEVTK